MEELCRVGSSQRDAKLHAAKSAVAALLEMEEKEEKLKQTVTKEQNVRRKQQQARAENHSVIDQLSCQVTALEQEMTRSMNKSHLQALAETDLTISQLQHQETELEQKVKSLEESNLQVSPEQVSRAEDWKKTCCCCGSFLCASVSHNYFIIVVKHAYIRRYTV